MRWPATLPPRSPQSFENISWFHPILGSLHHRNRLASTASKVLTHSFRKRTCLPWIDPSIGPALTLLELRRVSTARSRNTVVWQPVTEGKVSTVIDVLVSPQGTTVAMRPMQLIGCGVDEQVLKIVKTWSFKPARAEGIHGAVRFPCWFLTSP